METKIPEGWVKIPNFAELTGINEKTIAAAIKRGKIPVPYARRFGTTAISPYYLDPRKAAETWCNVIDTANPLSAPIAECLYDYIATYDPDAAEAARAGNAIGDRTGIALGEAKKREQIARTKLLELDVQVKQGVMVDRVIVDDALFAMGRRFRDSLLMIPDRIYYDIMAVKDDRDKAAGIMRGAISKEIDRFMEDVEAFKSKPR